MQDSKTLSHNALSLSGFWSSLLMSFTSHFSSCINGGVVHVANEGSLHKNRMARVEMADRGSHTPIFGLAGVLPKPPSFATKAKRKRQQTR
jgi:hypothetical protein